MTCTKAITSESSRTEHETVLKYRDGTYGNSSPSLSLSLSGNSRANCTAPGNKSTGLHLVHNTLEYIRTLSVAPLEQTRLSLEQHRNASSQERKHFKKIGSSSSLQGHSVTSSGSSTSNAISHDPNSREIEHLAAQSWEAHQRMVSFRLQRQTVIFTRSQSASER